jgi:2-polyprenyl-6-methoxyphenol hydroxylase-like FAD-dependent oxidoreductase
MFPLDLRKLDFPHPHGIVIPQARVEALLEQHAKKLGVEIRRGNQVVGLCQDEQGVEVEVRGPSKNYGLTAQYLAGCDGGHSVVRQQLGVAFPGLEHDRRAVGRRETGFRRTRTAETGGP